MEMIKQPTIPPMPKQPTFDARDTQYNLPIGKDVPDTNVGDTISRQAAIDAICNACGKIDCDKMDKCEKLQLPPANCSEFPNNSDTISRQAAIDALDKCHCGGKDENGRPWIYKENAVEAIEMVEPSPTAEPKRGKWILDRSGAYCCSECMEPCAGYVMMRPRDKFCKMCGIRNEVTE